MHHGASLSIVWLARPSHLNARRVEGKGLLLLDRPFPALSAPAIRWDSLASQTSLSKLNELCQVTTQYKSSEKVTVPLVALIMMQSQEYPPEAKGNRQEPRPLYTTYANNRKQRVQSNSKRECPKRSRGP